MVRNSKNKKIKYKINCGLSQNKNNYVPSKAQIKLREREESPHPEQRLNIFSTL